MPASPAPASSSSTVEPGQVPLRPVPWWGLLSALAAPVVLLAGYLYAAGRTPGFDPVAHLFSDLGAANSPTRWWLAATLGLLGACHVVTALGLRPADSAGRWLLGASGTGLWLVAALPNNTAGHFMVRHTFASAIAFGLFALWPAMSGHLGRPAWPLRRRVGVVVSVLGFVLIEATLFGIVTRSDTGGLRELLLYAATSLWPLVVVLWTRLAGPGTAVPPVRRPVVGAQPGATNGQGGATTG